MSKGTGFFGNLWISGMGRGDNKMRNIKLVIEYDGKSFNGWQKQPDKLNIQGEIEAAIEQVTGEKVELTASRKN